MPETSTFVAQMSHILGAKMSTIMQVQKAVGELLQLLQVQSVSEYLATFDLEIQPQTFAPILDSSFIEMSDIAMLVVGKKTAFNQNRRYYNQLAHKVVLTFANLRAVLEQQCMQLESGMTGDQQCARTLAHLAWLHVLYQNYAETEWEARSAGIVIDAFPSLQQALCGGWTDNSSLDTFNTVLNQFLLKWRLILTRMQGTHARFAEAFQAFMEGRGLSFPAILDSSAPIESIAILRRYDFMEVHNLCETVLTYIMPLGNMCLLDAAYRLQLFIQGSLAQFKATDSQNLTLDEHITRCVWQDFQRFVMNVGVIDEPEVLAVFLVFILTGKFMFFEEKSVVLALKAAFTTIKECVSALDGEQNSTGDALRTVICKPDVANVGVEFQKKYVRTGFNSREVKELVLNEFAFGTGKNIAECLVDVLLDVYCRLLAVYAKETQMPTQTVMQNSTRKAVQLYTFPAWTREKEPYSLILGLQHYVAHAKKSANVQFVESRATEQMAGLPSIADPTRISVELQKQFFGFAADTPEECAALIRASQQESLAIKEEFVSITEDYEFLASGLLQNATDAQRQHYEEMRAADAGLEQLISACDYLINATKKAEPTTQNIQEETTTNSRLVEILSPLVQNEYFHYYDADQVSALQQAIQQMPLQQAASEVRSTQQVLENVFDKMLAKTEHAPTNCQFNRLASMQIVKEEYFAARAIPRHQFDKICALCQSYVDLFNVGTLELQDAAATRKHLKVDANELMHGEDDAAVSLFVLIAYAGLIGYACEYGADGVAVKDAFTGQTVVFEV